MAFGKSKTVRRLVLVLSAGVLGAGISLASTLPDPVSKPAGAATDAAPSALLPTMMDASTSFADSGNTTPSTAAAPATPSLPLGPSASGGGVSSGDVSTGLREKPDHTGCVPEPVSTILMTSGLLGLIVARRFRSSSQRHDL